MRVKINPKYIQYHITEQQLGLLLYTVIQKQTVMGERSVYCMDRQQHGVERQSDLKHRTLGSDQPMGDVPQQACSIAG